MKKGLLIILSMIIISCDDENTANNTSNTGVAKAEFYFSFDESGATINDSSGNGNNATGKAISRVAGKKGKAIQFLMAGSTIELDDPIKSFPSEEEITFMAWIKTDHTISAREQIIGGWTGGAPGSFYPINNFGISLIDSRISFEVSAYPNMLSVLSDELPIVLNEWFHIAVTYDGDNIKFYYNGVLRNQGSIITNFNSSFNNQIGNNYYVYGGITIVDQFLGYIDEFYLINDVLDDSKILEYYNK